jgi:hypothetical protein
MTDQPINVRFVIDEQNLPDILANLEAAQKFTAAGKPYEAHIHRLRRSNPQNDYWHTLLRDIADKTGHSFEEVKDWVKTEFLGTKAILLRGKTIIRPRESSKLTADEMSLLIERTEALHADFG